MTAPKSKVLLCNCEKTIDNQGIKDSGCSDGSISNLCRSQTARFLEALAEGGPLIVGCTQEAPLFSELAQDAGHQGALNFVNIRETAGWSAESRAAGPKIAALVAMAQETPSDFGVVTLESRGVTLVLGRDSVAVEAAAQMAEALDITVLLTPGADVPPPRRTVFPVLQGRIRKASGHLGAFELTVDDYAGAAPSSRSRLEFGATRDGAVSKADLVVDLTGGTALFPAAELRPGYLRADPRDPVAVARTIAQAMQMVGTFDKPRFIDFTLDLCAHSRSRIIGCTRCLSLCPTGAITPDGNSVVIDPQICAGCGQCAAACPTGAAAYALPDTATLARQLRSGLRAYHEAGASVAPAILFHDDDHGAGLIDAMARQGRGLPAHVIPVAVNEITRIGPEHIGAALAYGATEVVVLGRGRARHDLTGLQATLALMATLAAAAGHTAPRLLETDDPDVLETGLYTLPRAPVRSTRASFLPPDDKRGLLTLALSEMNRTGPAPAGRVPLAAGAPFGAIVVDRDACTLCHACTGACPAGALADNPERPELRFTEAACVQCGLCAATCPEKAITLVPQADFAAWDQPRRILNEEEPFCCTACGKPFGTASGIARVQQRLGTHWMFEGEAGARRLALLTQCEDCRVRSVVADGFDPHAPGERRLRTTDDYH